MGSSFDLLYERIAVGGLSSENLENHHLQGAGEQVSLYGFVHGKNRAPQAPDRLFFSRPRVK
jgi:hypothetical protein